MKLPFKPCLLTISLVSGAVSLGQTIEWGSPAGIDIVDSYGAVLDNTFVFEVGAFAGSFIPTEENVSDWFSNWRVFDRADYNALEGVFTASVNMLDDGSSNFPSQGTSSFEGLNAYFWVRKGDDPVAGSEWFLARADSWVFPTAIPGCCDEGPPIQWSLSDLSGTNTPSWGNQGGVVGPGEYTVTSNTYELQTHTFVPEPSSVLLVFIGSGLLFVRRRTD